ncbi:MAG: protein-L-isoaspartate(D-aspartate) O-methyltransferase [Planctomycetota bacterium]
MRATLFSLFMVLVAGLLLHQPRIVVARTQTEPRQNQVLRGGVKAARRRMVHTVLIQGGIKNQRVINAMANTPRHEFVPRTRRALAYEDMALPISERQTISSPFIVAFMTETIDPQPTDRVLEIGTGSGYQAAVLSPLVRDVYTIEIVESLARRAQKTLDRLQYENVHTLIGDGFKGWPEHAPFDKILVTCSPEDVPQPLIDQLKEDGLMVIPVGRRYQQTLCLMQKRDGELERKSLRPTLFVPMTGTAQDTRHVLPDPKHPRLNNTGFEKPVLDTGFLPDWYYQRQAKQVASPRAPEGKHYLRITNKEPGKPGLVMQGFPIDGRRIARLEVSSWVKYEGARRGRDRNESAAIVVTFYNRDRERLGNRWIGPFEGSSNWAWKSEIMPVPPDATEAILRIGLFGGVGKICFDQVGVRGTKH